MITREGNHLVFTSKPCGNCNGTGKQRAPTTCPTCKGTGNGLRGGKRGCNTCFGSGVRYDNDHWETCKRCKGVDSDASELSNRYDFLPLDIWEGLTFKVYRSDRKLSYNESLLALGCAFSLVDYGKHKSMTDEEFIADVKKGGGIMQTVSVCDKEGNLPDHMGIFCADSGYSVRAVYNLIETAITIASEREYVDGMVVGMAMADAGLNGTIGAVYK